VEVTTNITEDGKCNIKILYWGPAGGGKTTSLDTLYQLSQERDLDITPPDQLTKISMQTGSTLYFDRGVFQLKSEESVFFHIYTVAGQTQLLPLRKKLFSGTDGVVFVADSQMSRWDDNVQSLKELKKVAQGNLISKIPLIVMLNKQDLSYVFDASDFQQLLREENLWYDPPHELSTWNPLIYECVALYDQERAIYKSFAECARRTRIYDKFGQGSAPARGIVKLNDEVPDL